MYTLFCLKSVGLLVFFYTSPYLSKFDIKIVILFYLFQKHYGTASKIYHFISDLNNSNKLQTEDVCVTLINTYCNHLYLQNSHLQIDRQKALDELSHVVENLTYLFEEMLEKNKTLNLQYPDILAKSLQWLFPNFSMVKIQQFLNNATNDKISTMFGALFKLNAQQRIPLPAIEDIHRKAQHIVETLNTYIMFDVIDTFQIQFCVLLMKYCRLDTHLQSDKAIAEVFLQLYEYLRLICAQKRSADFDCLIMKYCERFKELFEIYSKSTMNLCWFKDLLVFLNTLHIQMQNPTVFACFWKQMTTMSSYHAILTLLLETMKLAPCITPETKLNTFSCCSSVRKHIIFSSANIALSVFVLYCQNVKNEPKEEANTQIITAIQDVNQVSVLQSQSIYTTLKTFDIH